MNKQFRGNSIDLKSDSNNFSSYLQTMKRNKKSRKYNNLSDSNNG